MIWPIKLSTGWRKEQQDDNDTALRSPFQQEREH
jgi:hypothetical protein